MSQAMARERSLAGRNQTVNFDGSPDHYCVCEPSHRGRRFGRPAPPDGVIVPNRRRADFSLRLHLAEVP
jgi:hypothetical protein